MGTVLNQKMSLSSEMVEYNPQCNDSDNPSSLSVVPLLYVAALLLLHMKPKQRQPITFEVVEEVEVEVEDISPPTLPTKVGTRKLEAILVPSIQQGDLRQSIIYALAEFGPQTAKDLLNTLSDDFPDLPLKGKQGTGLNSHLYSMKKNKILGTSDASPPLWFVIET